MIRHAEVCTGIKFARIELAAIPAD